MKIKNTIRLSLLAVMYLPVLLQAQDNARSSAVSNNKKSIQMSNNSKQVLQSFFDAFGKGDTEGIFRLFHDDAIIVSVRDQQRDSAQLYGTYRGKEGVKDFLTNLGKTFDTRAFHIEKLAGDGDIALAFGNFRHLIRATGKEFASDWALVCIIKEGTIREYRFYEDSFAFATANTK